MRGNRSRSGQSSASRSSRFEKPKSKPALPCRLVRVAYGLESGPDLVEDGRIIDRRRRLVGFAVGDLANGAAQDLARAGLRQAADHHGGLERGDRTNAVANHADNLSGDLGPRGGDTSLQHKETER